MRSFFAVAFVIAAAAAVTTVSPSARADAPADAPAARDAPDAPATNAHDNELPPGVAPASSAAPETAPSARAVGAAKPSGLELAARLGVARATSATHGLPIGVPGLYPLWLDIGGRVTPELYLGGYLSYAVPSRSDCAGASLCRGSDVRFGGDVQVHLHPNGTIDPWLGIGSGVEILALFGGAGTSGNATRGAIELANLQFGIDARLANARGERPYRIGPFVALSTARTLTDSAGEPSYTWVFAGVRGALDL